MRTPTRELQRKSRVQVHVINFRREYIYIFVHAPCICDFFVNCEALFGSYFRQVLMGLVSTPMVLMKRTEELCLESSYYTIIQMSLLFFVLRTKLPL